jgi:hypothetical protein
MARAPKTLLETIYARTGSFRDTAKVQTLLLAWAAAMGDRNTDELGIEQFIVWAEDGVQSRATSKRQLALFRVVFPGHRDPNAVVIESGLRERMAPLVDSAHEVKDRRRTVRVSGNVAAAK